MVGSGVVTGNHLAQPIALESHPSSADSSFRRPAPECVSSARPAKRSRSAARVEHQAAISNRLVTDKLGTCVSSAVTRIKRIGFEAFVREHVGKGDWGPLQKTRRHPAHRLLRQYRARGAPVVLCDAPWSVAERHAAITRGPHKSAYEHIEFLRDEMASMVAKGQWVVVPYELIKDIPGLCLSPIGVVPQHDRRPRTICDLTFFGVNDATQPAAAVESMQFGYALERLLRHIVLSNPAYGPVRLAKVDLSDGFYRVYVRPADVSKLGMLFPSLPQEDPFSGHSCHSTDGVEELTTDFQHGYRNHRRPHQR